MSGEHEVLRRRIRRFFDTDLPAVLDGVIDPLGRAKAWRAALYDAGLAGLDVPTEMGGAGGGAAEVAVWREESRGRVPREDSVFAIGIGMALPTLRDRSPRLARRFGPPALRGDEIWCQLYSEPEAGSDLAALRTSALRDGDEWVVTGQKVWTSGAQSSQLAILLARTNPTAPKHRGITMFVLPMCQQGVTVRPLRQMTGAAEFNEVFLEGARIPGDWAIGDVDDGWRHAVALLAHERAATGTASVGGDDRARTTSGRVPLPTAQLVDLAAGLGRAQDPVVRQRLAALYAGERIMSWLGARGVSPSVGKLWRTRQGRSAAGLAAELGLSGGGAWVSGDLDARYWCHHVLDCPGMSIGGGTDEIQRNTLGERELGLPREPRDPDGRSRPVGPTSRQTGRP